MDTGYGTPAVVILISLLTAVISGYIRGYRAENQYLYNYHHILSKWVKKPVELDLANLTLEY